MEIPGQISAEIDSHPMSKIDEPLPWAYINNGEKRQAA